MIAFLLTFIPTGVELYLDRNGETAKNKRRQWLLIGLLFTIVSAINWQVFEIHPLRSLILCFAVRFMLLDYLINIILYKRGKIDFANWFEYIGSTASFDKIKIWVKIGKWGRFAVRLIVFGLALAIFAMS